MKILNTIPLNSIEDFIVLENDLFAFTEYQNSEIYIIDIDGKIIKKLKGHNDKIEYITSYNDCIISCSYDKTIRIWNSEGECIKILENQNRIVKIIKHKNYLICNEYYDMIKILNDNFECIKIIDNYCIGNIYSFNDFIIFSDFQGYIHSYNIENNSIKNLNIKSYVINTDNDYMITLHENNKIIKIWNKNFEFINEKKLDYTVSTFFINDNYIYLSKGKKLMIYDIHFNLIETFKFNKVINSIISYVDYKLILKTDYNNINIIDDDLHFPVK